MSDLSGINTNFAAPTLGEKPSTADSLNFQKAMFEYAIGVSAAQTGITTVGNLEKKSAGTTPQ